MAPRKSPKSGSPGPGSRREAKHGGSKNGKKEGLSGSSFFTWFMVIALLGVWTSVAVVWFELVDYEEVLAKAKDFRYNLSEVLQGKLGIYDADGDGDFDVEDAKALLGLKERSVPEHTTVRDAEEVIVPVDKQHVSTEPKEVEEESEDEIESLLRQVLDEQFESAANEEHGHQETNLQEEEEEEEEKDQEIPGTPTVEEEYYGELEDKFPEVLETLESVNEEPASDYQPEEPYVDDAHGEAIHQQQQQKDSSLQHPSPAATYEHHTEVEEHTYEPEAPDDAELTLEDALEEDATEVSEDKEHRDYADEPELENEDFIETQDADGEHLTEHYYENAQEPSDHTDQKPENEADVQDSFTEHTGSVNDREHAEDHLNVQPHATEPPVQVEDFSKDDLVDT